MIDNFIFDLDNTLYPSDCNLFAEIDGRMTQFIMDHLAMPHAEAKTYQKQLYVDHGTTLAGLMRHHDTDPAAFMDYVHEISLDPLSENLALGEAISALPGRKVIFTNGSHRHAERVAGKLGIWDCFDGCFDIIQANYIPKPKRETFDIFLAKTGIDPKTSIMFEDMADNLATAKQLGMQTVLIQTDSKWAANEPAKKRPAMIGEAPDFVDHTTTDITGFLQDWAS